MYIEEKVEIECPNCKVKRIIGKAMLIVPPWYHPYCGEDCAKAGGKQRSFHWR